MQTYQKSTHFPANLLFLYPRYYPSALGFLMFAVGINLSLDDFKNAFQRPAVLALGYAGQFVLKPLIGYALAQTLVPLLRLPDAIGKLVSIWPSFRLPGVFEKEGRLLGP